MLLALPRYSVCTLALAARTDQFTSNVLRLQGRLLKHGVKEHSLGGHRGDAIRGFAGVLHQAPPFPLRFYKQSEEVLERIVGRGQLMDVAGRSKALADEAKILRQIGSRR